MALTSDDLWPVAPNWRVPVEVQISYRTDIVTSRSGKEQRRSLRGQARRSTGFTVTVDRDDRRRVVNFLARRQAQPVLLSDPVRSVSLRIASPAAAGSVTVEDAPPWFAEDAQIVIGDDLVTITAVDGDEFTFTPVNSAEIPAGTTIRPALTGRLGASIAAEHPVSRAAEARVTFNIEPGSGPADDGDPGVHLLNGREVFAFRSNWSSGLTANFEWPTEHVDYGFGRTRVFTPIDYGWMTQTASFDSAASSIPDIERFFRRMQGRRGEFYMPTGLADLDIAADAAAGSTELRVRGTEVHADFASDPRYRAIAIRMLDRRLIVRAIAGMTVDAGDTVITTSAPWLIDIPATEVAMISWMPVVRFASDDLTLEHLSETVAQVQITTRSLEDGAVENPITGLDGAAQWLLENWGEGLDAIDRLQFLVNVRYPAIFWNPLAWVMVNEGAVDALDFLVNIEIPESLA